MRGSVQLVAVAIVLSTLAIAQDSGRLRRGENGSTLLEIELRNLGYKPREEYHYAGTGIPHDLSSLFDGDKKRLAFINDHLLAIYFSHLPRPTKDPKDAEARTMEAFFVAADSGSLISHQIWNTSKRKWFNERWDTQARILPVKGGFLVHAGDALTLYSSDLKKSSDLKIKGRMSLAHDLSWAVSVASKGRTFHLQRIDKSRADSVADGEWFDSESLNRLYGQEEVAGVTSASDHATVTKLAHCIELRQVGESPRKLPCSEPCRRGLPELLSETEILSTYGNGFCVLSTGGEVLWSREIPRKKYNNAGESYRRSLEGNRFAIALTGQVTFDGVGIPNEKYGILVYEESKLVRAFIIPSRPHDYQLSPGGNVLAVLTGETLKLYRTDAN